MNTKFRKHLFFIVGCCVTVVALWIAMQGVEWSAFATAMRQFQWGWILPGLATFYASMYLRAVRWGLLFRPHHQLTGRQMFRPIMICFAFNSILPGRAGEFVRSWMVGRDLKIGMTTALATVVAERVLDGLTLLAALALSFSLLPPMDPTLTLKIPGITLNAEVLESKIRALTLMSAVLVFGVVVLLLPWTQHTLTTVFKRMPGLPDRLRTTAIHFLHRFSMGFHALARPGVLLRILAHSVVIWLLVAVSNVAIARGFGLTMSGPQSLALITLIGLTTMIPAAPGYWGLYELGGVFSLLVLGVTADRSLALAYIVMLHSVQYFPIVAIGLWFALRSHVRPGREAPATKSD